MNGGSFDVDLHKNARRLLGYKEMTAGWDFRVHKSFLISVAHIKTIEGNTVYIHNKQIPISRSQREELMQQVVNRALLTEDGKK